MQCARDGSEKWLGQVIVRVKGSYKAGEDSRFSYAGDEGGFCGVLLGGGKSSG